MPFDSLTDARVLPCSWTDVTSGSDTKEHASTRVLHHGESARELFFALDAESRQGLDLVRLERTFEVLQVLDLEVFVQVADRLRSHALDFRERPDVHGELLFHRVVLLHVTGPEVLVNFLRDALADAGQVFERLHPAALPRCVHLVAQRGHALAREFVGARLERDAAHLVDRGHLEEDPGQLAVRGYRDFHAESVARSGLHLRRLTPRGLARIFFEMA